MPLTIVMGITRVNHFTRPVKLRKPTAAATKRPADINSSGRKDLAMATAAMAFIGCTGSGIPNIRPVKMLAMPLKTRVVDNEIEF